MGLRAMGGGKVAKVKVLQIIGGGEYGGAEQYLVNLTRQLKDSAIETHLACFYDSEFASVLRKHGITVHTLLPSSRFDFSLASKICRLIQAEGYQIVHTHGVRANFFARLAVNKLNRQQPKDKKIPIFTTIHSVLRQDYPRNSTYRIAYFMERITQHLTDQFIAISNSIKEDMIARGIPEQRIQVVYSGIDFEEFLHSNSTATHESRTVQLPAPPVIGMVGRLQPVKGHQYAIAAMPSILAIHTDAKLVLIGDGPLKEELQLQAEQLGVTGSIHFLGYQNPSGMASLLQQFDIFLMPSLSEGLGLSLIEAMAVGVPIIASRVGGMIDVVNEGTGILVPPQDPQAIAKNVIALLYKPEEARLMGERGKADVIERFNSQRMIEQLKVLYRA